MIAVAAGLARAGFNAWTYSIAPFIYARPFEQIRNDVCRHNLPVKLVGNGGGYGYGVQGCTHHALEDYGVLLTLPNLSIFVPTFGADVAAVVHKLQGFSAPAYLRLGATEEAPGYQPPPYAAWRNLLHGPGITLLATGPVASPILAAAMALDPANRPGFWVVAEFPLTELPADFTMHLRQSQCLIVVEEHVAAGGLGAMVGQLLLASGQAPRRFIHRSAQGYPSGLYGSQQYHRRECGLDPQSIMPLLSPEDTPS